MSEPFDGWRRIRTFESVANRFTVCPLWPLGNPSLNRKLLYMMCEENASFFLVLGDIFENKKETGNFGCDFLGKIVDGNTEIW